MSKTEALPAALPVNANTVQTRVGDNGSLVPVPTVPAKDVPAAPKGDVHDTARRAMDLNPEVARHLLGGLAPAPAKPITSLDLRVAKPELNQPYVLRGTGPSHTLWGTAEFNKTDDDKKLVVKMRWTEFDPNGPLDVPATGTHVPHRTANVDGVATLATDGSWQLHLPLPIPRYRWDDNMKKRDVRDLALTTDDGNKWSFDTIFYGRAVLEPSNWPKPLTEADAATMFALSGTTGDGTLSVHPKEVFFIGDGKVRDPSKAKTKLLNFLNSGQRRFLNFLTSGPVDFTPHKGTLTITDKDETHEAKFM